jgi:phage/plasmid primase-like uncharacterized protein
MTDLSSNINSLQITWEMLNCIPAEDRDQWIMVGMSIKSEHGDAGFSLFDAWSKSASNYNTRDVKAVWRSFNGKGRGIGSLVHTAQQYGWTKKNVSASLSLPKPLAPPRATSNTSAYAKRLFLSFNRDDKYVSEHKYAINKGIDWAAGAGRGNATGKLIGKNADCIIVPIRNIETSSVQGVQCINPEGIKQSFGSVSGGALIIGNTLNLSDTWYVVEGWASAVSTVHHHGKQVCACSFGKSNQDAAAQKVYKKYRPKELVILREVDA